MKSYLLIGLATLALVGCTSSDPETDFPETNQIADLRDIDNDGVINERDQCNETPDGALIDNNGCESFFEQNEQKLLQVLFENDSVELQGVFQNQIDEMVLFLTEYPETSIELQGYASKPGTKEHNQWLSEQRAINVREDLLAQGIAPERVTLVAFGNSQATYEDIAEQALDRKVIATVIGFRGDVVKEWTIFTTLEK